MKRLLLHVLFILGFSHMQSQAVDLIALDNTANLTLLPAIQLGSITTTNWQAKVFTVGGLNAVMKQVVLPLYETGSASRTVTLQLFAVDGSDNPTGSVLASDSYTQTFTNSATFYTIATTMGGFTMQSGQKYALVVSSTAPTSTMSWTGLSTSGSYPTYTPATGWTFDATRRSTNGGSSWSVNNYTNGMQMTVTVVPEPSSMLLAGLTVGGLILTRTRKVFPANRQVP